MTFYKQATDEDFKKELEASYVHDYEVIKKIIEEEKRITNEAINLWRNVTGMSNAKCKEELTKYLVIVNAYNDYKNGKVVYVDYN